MSSGSERVDRVQSGLEPSEVLSGLGRRREGRAPPKRLDGDPPLEVPPRDPDGVVGRDVPVVEAVREDDDVRGEAISADV